MEMQKMNLKKYKSRKAVRVVGECSVLQGSEHTREFFLAYTRDVSVWGAHMVSQQRVEVGERIHIKFEIPKYFLPVVMCADVLWQKELLLPREPAERVFELGVRFVYSDKRNKEKLTEYIEEIHAHRAA
jgi:hypothetical protein